MDNPGAPVFGQGVRAPADNPDAVAKSMEDNPAVSIPRATVKFDENGKGPVFRAVAKAEQGGALTYALGGEDASRFTIDQKTGDITFKQSPDYEAPTDRGRDNNYEISVTATDKQGRQSVQDVTIRVRDVREKGDAVGAIFYAGPDPVPGATGTDSASPVGLQAAIDAAGKDAIIFLQPGTYQSPGVILKEGQVLVGAGATDPITGMQSPYVGKTIIHGTSPVQGVIGLSQRSAVYGITATGGIDKDGDGIGDGVIGDVAHLYLLSGQSNASGHAFNSAAPARFFTGDTISNVSIWEDNRAGNGANAFQRLTLENNDGIEFNGTRHPGEPDTPEFGRRFPQVGNPDLPDYQHGVELYLAELLQQQHPDQDIYLVKVAQGGAGIEQWQDGRGNDLHRRLTGETLEAARALAEDGAAPFIGGLTWIQGETDAGRLRDAIAAAEAEEGRVFTPQELQERFGGPYKAALEGVVSDIAGDLGLDARQLPIAFVQLDIIAGASRSAGRASLVINADQQALADQSANWFTINTTRAPDGTDLTDDARAVDANNNYAGGTSDDAIHYGTRDFDYIAAEVARLFGQLD